MPRNSPDSVDRTAADLVETIADLRGRLAPLRRAGTIVGFVPTMGALHAGHARLIEEARRECGFVVVSIFVNPLQFERPEDLAHYPRTAEADVALCRELGVDIVFAPLVVEMYPAQPTISIEVGSLATHLCGTYRPGHFAGVATVVMKLFQIVQPERAYFGEKDAQQLAIVRRLVAELDVPVEIVGVATVREPDGLALSSRNRRLGPSDRASAIALYRALDAARRLIEAGETEAAAVKRNASAEVPQGEQVRVEYLEVVDPLTMQPVEHIAGPVLVAGALWVGGVRLIDNVRCGPPSS